MKGYRYLKRLEIDTAKWDQCISSAANGNIYGYAEYLDTMAEHWSAIVLNDYEAVLPLPWKKKYGLKYIYTPRFTSPLAIYGPISDALKVEDFFDQIPQKFKLQDLTLINDLSQVSSSAVKRKNHILQLLPSHEELRKKYRTSYRNLLTRSSFVVSKKGSIDHIIQLAAGKKKIRGTHAGDFARFHKLYLLLSSKGKALNYCCYGPNKQLLATAVFFLSHNRIYYMLAWNNEQGRQLGASHYLIDTVIKEYAGKDYWLDFEGSDIPGIAFFFEGFGATPETYYFLRINRLPWWSKWIKRR